MPLKGAELLIRCLEAEGVEYVFGLPGEETADLMISMLDSTVKFILTRHEQSAAFMADVYGRLTGKVGVCLATLGPGATNLTTGIASANMDRSRVLAITGQIDSNMLHKESHQNMDVITMFKPITKWNQSIRNGDNIPEIVRRAFKIANEEKAGATHIELPQDVAKQQSNIMPIPKQGHVPRSYPNKFVIDKAVKLILDSRKRLILVGNGCVRGNASIPIRKFVEKTGICSVNTFMAKGLISDKWERHLRTIGIKNADHALIAMKDADLVIAIGYDLVEYNPKFWNGDFSKNIIHIDFTPAEVDTYYCPSVEIAADIESTINAILTQLHGSKAVDTTSSSNCFLEMEMSKSNRKIKKEIIERANKYKEDSEYPIKPERLITDVRKLIDSHDILISDVGAHKLWIAKIYETFHPNTCLISNGFASMGFALPGAIAAQLAFPHRKIVVMCGDGGFLMNVQELETAVRLRLPLIVIIWCDREYGVISLKQIEEFGKKAFTEFNNPDFVKLAKSFGAIGYAARSVEEFSYFFKKGKMSKHVPVIISVDVDYSRNRILLDDDFLA
ncbi:MAG: acetolactate synthase large subunit [Nitrososphaeraceae archaeon]